MSAWDLNNLQGQTLGNYRLMRVLGAGGMAVVFEGVHVATPQIVRAIKVIRPELTGEPAFLSRFVNEATMLERLQSPHVVRFHALNSQHIYGLDLYVMELELLEGETIAARRKRQPGPVGVVDACRWVFEAAQGVGAAHALGMVHRDLKPDNLFLTRAGVVKILDFGIAKAADEANQQQKLTALGVTVGTPAYLSPEVCNGATAVAASDVYALGIILHELLLGHHPFIRPGAPRMSPAQFLSAHLRQSLPPLAASRPDVPPSLARVLEQATQRDARKRLPNALALAEALRPWCAEQDDEPATMTIVPLSTGFVSEEELRRGRESELVDTTTPKPAVSSVRGGAPASRVALVVAGIFALLCVTGLAVVVLKFAGDRPETQRPSAAPAQPVRAPVPAIVTAVTGPTSTVRAVPAPAGARPSVALPAPAPPQNSSAALQPLEAQAGTPTEPSHRRRHRSQASVRGGTNGAFILH